MSIRRAWEMDFRSVGDLERDVYRLLPSLPRDIAVVVGIPRSGLLPATLLSLHLNVPLTDMTGLAERRVLGAGMRSSRTPLDAFPTPGSTILIVDDSVGRGVQLRRIKDQLRPLESTYRVLYAAVYTTEEQRHLLDFYASTLPARRVFGWNVMHHPALRHSCVQFEGLLAAVDPMSAPSAIATAQPRFCPTTPVHTIIARQHPEGRHTVQAWLARHGIAYTALTFVPARSDSEWVRRTSEAFRRSRTNLFVVVDGSNASLVARRSGMPVLELPSAKMHQPSLVGQLRVLAQRVPGALQRRTAPRALRRTPSRRTGKER